MKPSSLIEAIWPRKKPRTMRHYREERKKSSALAMIDITNEKKMKSQR